METFERIRLLRKQKLKLTQERFGEQLGVSRSVIANIETNVLVRPEQKEPLYRLICEKFHVSYKWLTSGEGEMFSETRETYVDDLCQKLNIPDFAKRALLAYLDLSSEEQAVVEKYIYSLAEKQNTAYEEITCGELEDMRQSELEAKEDAG